MTTYTWKTCQNNSWTNTDCWKDGAYPNDATANTTIELTSNLTITFDDQHLPLGFHLGNLSITTSNGSALSFLCVEDECATVISNLAGNADLTLTRGFYVILNSSDYENTISVIGAQLTLREELPRDSRIHPNQFELARRVRSFCRRLFCHPTFFHPPWRRLLL